jgi:hypothetical protein
MENHMINLDMKGANSQIGNQISVSHQFEHLPNNQNYNDSKQFASFPLIGQQSNEPLKIDSSSPGLGYITAAMPSQQQYQFMPQLTYQNQFVPNHMIPMPQMPNHYSKPYTQFGGSQTRLDQLTNNMNYEHNFGNQLAHQPMHNFSNSFTGNRFSSCENLQSVNGTKDQNQQKSQMESGLHLIQLLREAEKSGFTADDVEVAINFSPDKPLGELNKTPIRPQFLRELLIRQTIKSNRIHMIFFSE